MKELNIYEIMQNSTLEELFQIDIKEHEWIWVNRDIFFDIIYNVLEYDSVKEEDLKIKIDSISEKTFIEILDYKFEEIGWIQINQKIFAELIEDFIPTKDIDTYIYVNKKFYTIKIIRKINELSWTLKAMAVDMYQYLDFGNKKLIEIYEEYFNENSMIIEDLLLKKEYKLNVATWRLNREINLLEFYKTGERYRQWSEHNSNFMFSELNK